MACILNMSNSWKKFTQLRIHVVESRNHPCPTTAEIEQFIHAMRIKAVIKKFLLLEFNIWMMEVLTLYQ